MSQMTLFLQQINSMKKNKGGIIIDQKNLERLISNTWTFTPDSNCK